MKKPRNYYCHRTPTSLPPSLPQHYQLIDKIGEGAFGQVYKIFNKNTSNIQVMKCNKGEHELIIKQTQIMQTMNHSDGFAKVKQDNTNNDMIIMTLLGQNLGKIRDQCAITVFDMKRIAYQCVLRLKELHGRGFVHRDIKPENILLGNKSNPHKVYVVDFGLTGKFKKSTINPRKIYNSQIGTVRFCPIASHLGLQQFPKDDLQSLGYVLIFLIENKLPWCSYPRGLTQKQKFQTIRKMKSLMDLNKLCEGINCLKKYFKIIRQLLPSSQVDYNKLLQIFKTDSHQEYCYSFCSQTCPQKQKRHKQQDIQKTQEQSGKIPSSVLSQRQSDIYQLF